MAIEDSKTLKECRSLLKKRLDGCFARIDDPDPEKQFAPRDATREIFEIDRLRRLLRFVLRSRSVEGVEVEHTVNQASEKIRGDDDKPKYCNVLATLLYSKCTDQTLKEFVRSILATGAANPVCDDDLPLNRAAAIEAFGEDDGQTFRRDQYLFCPVILKENDESRYIEHRAPCRMPFLEEPKVIGKGAFATVKKVVLARGHLMNEREKSSHDHKRNEFAQKEFDGYNTKARGDFAAEVAIMTTFIRSPKRHENILITKASLESGSIYSLFFDLARCDLWQYLTNKTISIIDDDAKAKMFKRTIGLAGALAYLHDEIYLADTNENLQCYHLDLKPQNILVFDRGHNEDIWKISDFGISKIKVIPHDKTHPEGHYSLEKIFRRKESIDSSSGVENARYGGSYAAPEARQKSDIVFKNSDVWSLGCVIALIVTFVERQTHGIHKFQEARRYKRSQDWFFNSNAIEMRSNNGQTLHSSVLSWFDGLRDEASIKGIPMALNMLQEGILLLDHTKRWPAKRVEKELQMLSGHFLEPARDMPTSSPSTHKRAFTFPHLLRSRAHQTEKPTEWSFGIPKATTRCKFSPNGKFLSLATNVSITTKSEADIKKEGAGRIHNLPNEKRLRDFNLGSEYLCVGLESHYFEFSMFPFQSESTQDVHHVKTQLKSPIRKVTLSPDDKLIAFVLKEPLGALKLVLYRTQDIIDRSTSSTESDSHLEDSAASDKWHTFDEGQNIPWRNVIESPQHCKIPPTDGLVDLEFCRNSEVLIAVTKQYRDQESQSMYHDILTWDVNQGRLVSHLRDENKGSDDLGETWSIRSLAVFAYNPLFVTLSRQRIRLGNYRTNEYDAFSKVLGDQILDVVVDEDNDDRLILLGKHPWKGKTEAFMIPTDKIKGLETLGTGMLIGLDRYDALKDSCRIRENNAGKALLVASLDLRRLKGTLCQMALDLK